MLGVVQEESRKPPPPILIAGAGPAGVEAMLALRRRLPRTPIELVAPDEKFVLRALSVREPFGVPSPPRPRVARMAELCGVRHRREALTHVDPAQRQVTFASGAQAEYSALLVAVGGRQVEALASATTFWGTGGDPAFSRLLDEAERDHGAIEFLVPHRVRWSLPVYELAIATADWLVTRKARSHISVLTPEARPLIVLGGEASGEVERLLRERGIELQTSVDPLEHTTDAGAHAVALPRLVGRPIPDLPRDEEGFLPTDEFGRVSEADRVYGAGDATDSTIKQGGLAAQQADAAASAIAADLSGEGAPVASEDVLRARVVGDTGRRFLSGQVPSIAGAAEMVASWSPGTKVFGRYLSPFLADLERGEGSRG